jgi:hypothetical protein
MSYILYNETGQIVSAVSCANTEPDGPTGFLVLSDCECHAPKEFYVANGTLVAMAPKPAGHMVFDYATKLWTDVRDLASVKLTKSQQINAWRAEANQTSFTYGGKAIACDALSRSDIDGVNGEVSLTGLLPNNWPGGWKCMDNSYVAIPDKATWIQFYQAMTAQGTTNFLHSQTLKTTLANATTLAEIDGIVW